MGWLYRKDINMPNNTDYIVRQKGILLEDWNSKRKTWQPSDDMTGVFSGFESGYEDISEKQANDIVLRYSH